MSYSSRLNKLRAVLAHHELNGFVVAWADEHLSEYVDGYAQRLAWISGFQGAFAWAVVLQDEAAIFVDGRYTLEVGRHVDTELWSCHELSLAALVRWLGERVGEGSRIGYDPWLHSEEWVESAIKGLSERHIELVAVDRNPIDEVWIDRPPPSVAWLTVYPDSQAGRTSAQKRLDITRWLMDHNADAVLLSPLDSIAWTFNFRGRDLEHTPVPRAYALIGVDGSAELFVEPQKLTPDLILHLGTSVRVHPYGALAGYLATLRGKRVAVDPQRAVSAVFRMLESAGARVTVARDPVLLAKAIKNDTEIASHRAAQARDSAAVTAFLHWLSIEAPKGYVTEMSAAEKLREFREATGCLQSLSAYTISGAGPNSALPVYRVTQKTNRRLQPGSLYLVDSGGQYLDGTTDITRTVVIGIPTEEIRDRFTRVLKGHIALATVNFPVGTTGIQLDALARQYLWAAGLDYAHGTGHGVGHYLHIHEGPQRIAHTGFCAEPLLPGMILSNEPGYYKPGAYGIRIENLMLVRRCSITGGERDMLCFETLTAVPIDRSLLDLTLLSQAERSWLDAYHAKVAETVGPLLEGDARLWLLDATRSIA